MERDLTEHHPTDARGQDDGLGATADTRRARFDALFDGNDDPWRFRERWYEARKRALTLASLPDQRYECGYEPGCANGELSAALAERCDRLLVSDGSTQAVALARQRLAHLPHVEVREAWLPREWPEQSFDLIVLSELGYYFEADGLEALALKARASLREGGTLLACHWRWPIAGWTLDGTAVHRHLATLLGLPRLCSIVEPDLLLDVWSSDPRSVGEREGLV